MKQAGFVGLLLLFSLTSHCQLVTFYMDPNHYSIVTLNQAVRMGAEQLLSDQTNEIRNNTAAENASMTQLLVAKELVYRTLTTVNDAVRSGIQVQHITSLMADVLDEAARVESLVADAPDLLFFARKATNRVKLQAVDLYNEVNSFILKGGVEALMNYDTRDELLQSLVNRLQLLRGTLFSLYRSLYWAKLRGSWRTLNPFSQWVNQDRLIIDRILIKSKTL